MVKAIKKRTKAQTPAPKKDRVKGSKTNPKGSASGGRGGIEIGEKATKALENMRDEHNGKYKKASVVLIWARLRLFSVVALARSLFPIDQV